jgi:imidazole glycerol-phosphate synthase subunit HisH
MHVAIIDYGSGNLHSAAKAFERAGREQASKLTIKVTSRPEEVRSAERIVLPGVGAFADCRKGLAGIPGMIDALEESVRGRGKPFFGICVGLQLMAESGREHGLTPGLGWIGGEVRAIAPSDASLKIPHMGWNTLSLKTKHALFEEIPTGETGLNAYFVHSYHFVPSGSDALVATTEYGGPITAFVAKDNMAGSQFHPEKSQKLGLKLIANFLKWKP